MNRLGHSSHSKRLSACVCMTMEWYGTVGDDEGEVHEGNAADDLLIAELLSQGVIIG